MSSPEAARLLAEARDLDAQAFRSGERTREGRDSRAQAAALRIRAIGDRVYPVLVCEQCFRLTGWTTASGLCDVCACHVARVTAERLSGMPMRIAGPVRVAEPRAPLLPRAVGLFGRRERRDRERVAAWMAHVEPGETGPIDPEDGYQIEVATRDEVACVDGTGMLVRFATFTHVFADSRWERRPTTRLARWELPNPAEFAADLPMAVLVEAWGDYRDAVGALNLARYAAESDASTTAQANALARGDLLREQARTSELLGD